MKRLRITPNEDTRYIPSASLYCTRQKKAHDDRKDGGKSVCSQARLFLHVLIKENGPTLVFQTLLIFPSSTKFCSFDFSSSSISLFCALRRGPLLPSGYIGHFNRTSGDSFCIKRASQDASFLDVAKESVVNFSRF